MDRSFRLACYTVPDFQKGAYRLLQSQRSTSEDIFCSVFDAILPYYCGPISTGSLKSSSNGDYHRVCDGYARKTERPESVGLGFYLTDKNKMLFMKKILLAIVIVAVSPFAVKAQVDYSKIILPSNIKD